MVVYFFCFALLFPMACMCGCGGRTSEDAEEEEDIFHDRADEPDTVDTSYEDTGEPDITHDPPLEDTPDILPEPEEEDNPEEELSGIILFHGFSFDWQRTPHRINKIGQRIGESTLEEDGRLFAPAQVVIEGGSWASGEEGSDTAGYDLYYTALSTRGAGFMHGSAGPGEMHGSITLTDEIDAEVTRSVEIDLEGTSLETAQDVAVILSGFVLDTDLSHEFGYTTKGFGIRILNIERTGNLLTFDIWARMEAGKVPDRIQNLESYSAWVTVDYTVVGIEDGDVTAGSHNYQLFYEEGVEPDHPHASREQQEIVITGTPGLEGGFIGLSGFNFALNEYFLIYPGRYMRSVNVILYDFDYQAVDGLMTFYCDGYFSNSGLISYELLNDFTVDFVLIQVDDGPAAITGQIHGTAEETITDLFVEETM